jgi:hypothetical protein
MKSALASKLTNGKEKHSKKIDYGEVEISILLICALSFLFTACNPQPDLVHTETTPIAAATAEVVQKMNPIPAIEITPTQEIELLAMNFGLESKDVPVVNNVNVDSAMRKVSEKNGSDYPFNYFVYIENGKSKYFTWSKKYNPDRVGTTFSDQLGVSVDEEKIFEKVMKDSSFSEYSIKPCYQKVIYVTKETGEDGITRNGFFSYSESGIAIYIDVNNVIRIFNGNNIDVDDPEVRSLFERGYTQVRIVDGQPKGFFNINNLPSRILASMK